MAKHIITFFTVALLLSFQLTTSAARPVPAAFTNNAPKTQHHDIEAEIAAAEEGGSCEGIEKEECLMRRTLAAHTDYIYTQQHKP